MLAFKPTPARYAAFGLLILAFSGRVEGAEANSSPIMRLAASVERSLDAALFSARLQELAWDEKARLAGSTRLEASSGLMVSPYPALSAAPEIRASVNGLDFEGSAAASLLDGGRGELGLGYNLINTERTRIRLLRNLSAQAGRFSEAYRCTRLLQGLKNLLSLRNSLAKMQEAQARRAAFRAELDTLLIRLRPFAEGRLIAPNALNNLRALKDANAFAGDALQRGMRLLMQDIVSASLIDTADFSALDIRELIDTIQAFRRSHPDGAPTYEDISDSLASEVERSRMDLDRIQDRRLSLGVAFSGANPSGSEGSFEPSLGVRLGLSGTFGGHPRPRGGPPLSLRRPHPASFDPLEEEEVQVRADSICADLKSSLETRLNEIRMGQINSVYALSESLGYQLDLQLQASEFAYAFRERFLSGIHRLEELGVPAGKRP